MPSFPVVFVSSAQESDHNRINSMEKGCDTVGEKIESHYFLENLQIFFHGSPDFPLPGVGRSAVVRLLPSLSLTGADWLVLLPLSCLVILLTTLKSPLAVTRSASPASSFTKTLLSLLVQFYAVV